MLLPSLVDVRLMAKLPITLPLMAPLPKFHRFTAMHKQAFPTNTNIHQQTFKTFPFSLPFGGENSFLNSISIPSPLKIKKALFNSSSPQDEDTAEAREVIRNKIERQLTISTQEEEIYYKGVSKLDNGKFTAMKKALTAPITSSIDNGPISIPNYLAVYDQLEGDVIVMGGYRGSILRDAHTGRRAWIPVLKAGLNIKKIDLLLGPKDEHELNATEKIYPDGVLSHVGPVDICRKLMRRLDSNPKVHVHDWGYDWRLSGDLIAGQLHQKLLEINKQNGGKPVLIIAHSMGGIIAHAAMLKEPKLVRGIIYAGTPLPCCNMLGPLRFADQILLCKDLLTSEVNFMMRSSYLFVPRQIRLFKDINTGERYDIDFFKAENWVKYNLSPIVSNVRLQQERGEAVDPKMEPQQSKFAISFDDAYDYLQRTLSRTAKFLDALWFDPKVYCSGCEGDELSDDINDDGSKTNSKQRILIPPLAVVYGNSVPSVKYSMVNGIQDIINGKYYDFFYGPGDGVTHQNWIFPVINKWPVVGKFASGEGHVGLLTDFENIGKALLSILREENRRKMTFTERKF
ncbi:unnamed protein product [Ambrosiozyma monospora]|uniref:Unnamed protein product n=1 Tax=Ambrosiozyma monospora TaxID=43982 RepID=A0ACB5T8K7_AMBMO|nr:unnamed protein product [Ambrosiozyma monospora]